MKPTVVVSCLAATIALPAGLAAAAPTQTQDGWALATSTQRATGRVIVFRYQNEFPAGFSRASYPDRVILVWRYVSDSGMPDPGERQRMDLLEDLLKPKVEAGAAARLVLVSTGDNLREWTYYAKSEDDFLAKLNVALRGQPAFPIEIHAGPDPKWMTYEDFRKQVRTP